MYRLSTSASVRGTILQNLQKKFNIPIRTSFINSNENGNTRAVVEILTNSYLSIDIQISKTVSNMDDISVDVTKAFDFVEQRNLLTK